jgi:hypothetical protein
MPHSEASTLFWVVFLTLVIGILVIDLGVLHRRAHTVGLRESAWLASGYAGLAVLFGIGVWIILGAESGANYFTAYVVEQSLSIDNVFVMSVIFAYFGVPREYLVVPNTTSTSNGGSTAPGGVCGRDDDCHTRVAQLGPAKVPYHH